MSNNAFRTISANFIEGVGTTRNYIKSSFESGTTNGWGLGTTGTLTNALPTGTPTFGSGAAGTLSFAASSSAFFLISGSSSGSLVSTNASTPAGNMLHSDPLAIDPADRAKVLSFKFNYLFANAANCNLSGTSSNTFGVAVYDVTNSAWIPVVGAFNIVQSSGVGTATGTFQTNSTTASLRFCFYMANAASGIYSLGVDDFFLGPQTITTGAAMTDPVQFAPTIVGHGTVTTNVAYSWRCGSNLFVKGSYIIGTGSAVTLQIGLGFNGAAGNVVVDTSKVSPNALIGDATLAFSSTTYFGLYVLAPPSNQSYVQIGTQASTSNATAPALGSNVGGNGQTIEYSFSVPIVGWSSNTQQSSDSDQRTIVASGYFNTTALTTTTSTLGLTAIRDTNGATGASSVNILVSGDYVIDCYYSGNTGSGTANDSYLNILVNGNSVKGSVISSTYNRTNTVHYENYFKAGDVISFQGAVNATPNVTTPSTIGNTGWSVKRMSGSAVVQATESVNARYSNTSGQSLVNATTTTLTGWIKIKDSHGAFNPSTGVYTFVVSGTFRASLRVNCNPTTSTIGVMSVSLVQAGSSSLSSTGYTPFGQSGGFTSGYVTDDFVVVAGDTLTLQAIQNNGANLSIIGSNSFSIERVGN